MRRRHWLIGIGVAVALFAAVIALSALLPTDPSRQPDSVTNPRPDGTMALAQVLQSQGVQVRQVTSLDEAAQAPARSTLLINISAELSDAAISRLRATPADLVLLYTSMDPIDSIAELTDGKVGTTYWWRDGDEAPIGCTDQDARTARQISTAESGLYAIGQQVQLCFLDEDGNGLYTAVEAPGHKVTVVAGSEWLHNDTITTFGNAALALRVLGRHPQLTWYLPSADAFSDDSGDARIDACDLLPPWFGPVSALLGLALVAAAGWRGRRFGPLVAERLPVAAPASEVASGLARLYRQGGAHAHAAAALRAASLHRLGVRFGLPTTATPDLVVERLARAGGVDPQQLRTLYYGPAPDTDSDLVALATQLSDLEAKVTSHE